MSVRPVRRSGPVMPHQATPTQRLIARLVHAAVCACEASQPVRWVCPPETLSVVRQQPVIFAIWHNRLAFSLVTYRRLVQTADPTRRLAALVSASRDGALLAAIMECFGVQPVRGSSSRRGPQALLELSSWAERGLDLSITPDGPRGPRYEVQPGAIAIAKLTGMPVVPASLDARWKIELRSWDRFQLPLPFAGYRVILGETLTVPHDDTEPLEVWQQALQRRLMDLAEAK